MIFLSTSMAVSSHIYAANVLSLPLINPAKGEFRPALRNAASNSGGLLAQEHIHLQHISVHYEKA